MTEETVPLTRIALVEALELFGGHQQGDEHASEHWIYFICEHGAELIALSLAALGRIEPRRAGTVYEKHKLGPTQQRIVDALRSGPPKTLTELAEGLGINYQNTRRMLPVLRARGLISSRHDPLLDATVWQATSHGNTAALDTTAVLPAIPPTAPNGRPPITLGLPGFALEFDTQEELVGFVSHSGLLPGPETLYGPTADRASPDKDPAAVSLGPKAGKARAAKLTSEERSASASVAATKRWNRAIAALESEPVTAPTAAAASLPAPNDAPAARRAYQKQVRPPRPPINIVAGPAPQTGSPVVPVEQITAGVDLFFCPPYSCKLLARSCVERQARFANGESRDALRSCGDCETGREVARRSQVVIDVESLRRKRSRPGGW